jgi:hypothetical protein
MLGKKVRILLVMASRKRYRFSGEKRKIESFLEIALS